ncbi:unnamed protein product [Trichogramma brassicae]|uniref:Uncharacterized protein n=1 Tax=Trichogramma brassicae TaxID=86971 RepID=A0A6H5I8Y2_9HYME|nr:unnamed protein product [Trichogramma brassicae]
MTIRRTQVEIVISIHWTLAKPNTWKHSRFINHRQTLLNHPNVLPNVYTCLYRTNCSSAARRKTCCAKTMKQKTDRVFANVMFAKKKLRAKTLLYKCNEKLNQI